MSIDRTTINLGPGHFLFGASLASTMYCTNIALKINTKWLEIRPGGFGRIDRRKVDETFTLTLTPIGELNSAIAAMLWPYGSTAMGASIFGATDTAFGIQTLSGQKFSFTCGAITKMPKLMLGAGLKPYDQFELTCIIGNSLDRTNAAALYTLAANAWSGHPTSANVVTLPVAATWALGSPETIVAKNGWEIDFDLQLDWQTSADVGTFDARFRTCEARAKCLPIGYSEARLAELKIQNTGGAIGTSSRVTADLTLAQPSGGITVVLKNALFDDMAMQFADNADRFGDVIWLANRALSAGYGALFTVAMS